MVMTNKNPVVVLLGNYRPSLIMARMFKRRGYDVIVGTHGCERLCQYSAAVTSMWDHSPLNCGPEVLASELKQLAAALPELTAIIPVAEEYVRQFAENEALFDGLPDIVSMESELVLNCLNKEYMLKLASSIGVPTAHFAYTSGMAEALDAGSRDVGYPMVMRPRDSTKRISGNKAVIVECEDDLVKCFNRDELHGQILLLQQKFEGKRHNVYFAAVDGDATRLLHAVIDRTDKPDGTGLAVDGRTLDTDHMVVNQTIKLLGALNYCGIGCAQFLVDEKTGKTSFLEINPRIAGNHALPEHAGLDLAWFNFERVKFGNPDKKIVTPVGGIRYCWTTGDLMGAKVSYLRNEIGIAALFVWLMRAMKTAFGSNLHMVFSRQDPYPAIRGMWNLIPRIARWRAPQTETDIVPVKSSEQRIAT